MLLFAAWNVVYFIGGALGILAVVGAVIAVIVGIVNLASSVSDGSGRDEGDVIVITNGFTQTH